MSEVERLVYMKKTWINFLTLMLSLAMLMMSVPVSVASVGQEPDNTAEYKLWSQSDTRWANKLIGKKTMSTNGSLVTALAKLIVHAGQRNPSIFDPGVCLDELKEANIFKGSDSMYMGLLDTEYFPTAAPELTGVINSGLLDSPWTEDMAYSEISSFINNGFYVIIMTLTSSGITHWMCVDNARDGKVYVMDNLGVCDLYSQSNYTGVGRYMLVKYSGNKSYPAYDGKTTPVTPPSTEPERNEVYSVPSALRVREEPNLSCKTLRYLSLDERITINRTTEADGYVWGHLSDDSGWCAISICKYISGSLFYIKYDVGSASFSQTWQKNPTNRSVILSDEKPTLDGYEFVGWTTGRSSANVDYNPGDTVSVNEDVILYPVWKRSGETPAPTPLPDALEVYITPDALRVRSLPTTDESSKVTGSLPEGSLITIDSIQEADGYVWGHLSDGSGWCAVSICSYFSGSLFFVRYEIGNAYMSTVWQYNPSMQSITLTDEIPSLPEHKFIGWSTSPDSGGAEYLPGDSVNIDAGLVLYPVWSDKCVHSYESNVVPPDENSCGYTQNTCIYCEHSFRNNYTDSLGSVRISGGMLIVNKKYANGYKFDIDDFTVRLDGKQLTVDKNFVTAVEKDNITDVTITIFGAEIQKGSKYNIGIETKQKNDSISFVATGSLKGYTGSVVSLYRQLCNVTVYSDFNYKIGEKISAVTDGGVEYSFTVIYIAGNKYVFSCSEFDADTKNLSFGKDNFAVSCINASDNIQKLACPSDRYFAPYYQVRQNESDKAKSDLRFVFVANIDMLKNIESANVEIVFYKAGKTVKNVSGILGGVNGNYKLFTALTAAGDIYVAENGCAIFGQEIIGVPDMAFDSFTVKITDRLTGNVLLSVSLN